MAAENYRDEIINRRKAQDQNVNKMIFSYLQSIVYTIYGFRGYIFIYFWTIFTTLGFQISTW